MILSYTLLNCYQICPHQAHRRYIRKDIPTVDTPALIEGRRGHQMIEQRIRHKTPLPPDLVKHERMVAPLDAVAVEPECKLGVTAAGRATAFFADDVYLRGTLDAPWCTASDTAILLDWKFGKPREDPFELEVGAVLWQAHHPLVTALYGQYVWLKTGERGHLHNLSDTKRTWSIVRKLGDAIANARQYPKTPGPLCAWCPVTDCQHNKSKHAA